MSSNELRFRFAIFDFDGTLADSAEWFAQTLNAGAERFGYRAVSDDELQTLRGLGNREIIRRLGVPAWRMPAIARHFRSEASRSIHHIRMFPGASEMLARLRSHGVGIAILSSNSQANIRTVLGPEATSWIADFACGSSLFGKATKLRRLLRANGVPAAEAIAIGDDTRDIEAARNAGVAAAAVTWGYATRAALAARAPDLIFDDFSDLLRVFGSAPSRAAGPTPTI